MNKKNEQSKQVLGGGEAWESISIVGKTTIQFPSRVLRNVKLARNNSIH